MPGPPRNCTSLLCTEFSTPPTARLHGLMRPGATVLVFWAGLLGGGLLGRELSTWQFHGRFCSPGSEGRSPLGGFCLSKRSQWQEDGWQVLLLAGRGLCLVWVVTGSHFLEMPHRLGMLAEHEGASATPAGPGCCRRALRPLCGSSQGPGKKWISLHSCREQRKAM